MNGQNPNNQDNLMNGMNNEANVLGNAQPLGQVPNMPNPNPAPTVPPIPPIQPNIATGNPVQPNLEVPPAQPTTIVEPTGQAAEPSSYTAMPNDANGGVNPSGQTPTMNNGLNNDTVVSPTGESINLSATTPNNSTMNVPGTAPINGNAPVGMDPINPNGFVEPNKVESIGTMPPPQNQPKAKKPMNKVLFVILIVALMGAVAAGVMIVLKKVNGGGGANISVTTKDLTISVGDTLSNNITDYATITGTDSNNCVLNNLNVNTKVAGEYQYSIQCDSKEYTGKVIVEDKEGPILNVQPIYKKAGSDVVASDFVTVCDDNGKECSKIEFIDAASLKNNLATPGIYNIAIRATDSSENVTEVNAPLYVLETDLIALLSCSAPATDLTEYKATKTVSDILALGNPGTGVSYLNVGRREYKYEFADADAYKEVTSKKDALITFDNVTGLATYDDENNTLTISSNLASDVLNTEAGGALPTDYNALSNEYYPSKGYTCKIVMN